MMDESRTDDRRADEAPVRGPSAGVAPVSGADETRRDRQTPLGSGYADVLEQPDAHRYLRVLYKRRWTAVTAFLLVGLTGAIWSFTSEPVYEARVRVLVETARLNLVNIEDVVEQQETAETQQAILQSRWLARKTLESLEELPVPRSLVSAPPAAGSDDGLEGSIWSAVIEPISLLFGWRSPRPALPLELNSPERLAEAARIDGFLAGLVVVPPVKGILEIKYRSSDPVRAATLANTHARQYIEQNLELRFAAIREVTDWLSDRLGEQRQKVNVAEEALQRFREANGLVRIGELEQPLVAKVNELTTALTRAAAARFEKESIVNQLKAVRPDLDTVLRMPQLLADPVVQNLRLELTNLQRERAELSANLTERHPDMARLGSEIRSTQAKLQIEIDRVIESLRADVATARAAETRLQAVLDEQKRTALVQNEKILEASILEREAESSRQIYDMLLQRARETNIAKEIRPTESRILDAAEIPRTPIGPNHRRDVTRSLLLGLGLALALVFGFEHLDNRIKLPDEIRTHLGLPFLGLLPEVRSRSHSTAGPFMANGGVAPDFVEAVRSLRTNVLFSFTRDGLRSVLVTSAGPAEGKTVVAANLAVALAQSGARVLLIDADLRRPALHQLFKRKREPGLTNLLVGNAKATDAVRGASVPNLWLLPAGHKAPNPPELLGSGAFKKLLAGLESHFQWVIVDTPPVLPVTDACVTAALAQGVLFVVGAERVGHPAARRAIEQLDAVGAHIIGAVLSRADLERNGYYYRYAGYYDRKYDQYYTRSSSAS